MMPLLTTMLLTAAPVIGSDAAACTQNAGPAIEVAVTGLKDRTGRLKLELYPYAQDDFLKPDYILQREGKFFRRVWADIPPAGPVNLCIRVPRPGTYALLFTHNRDNQNKFDIWKDGAGTPGNGRIGRSRPSLAQARITVGEGVTNVSIRTQYLRSIFTGFGPSD